jgi:multidrug resistance efflux pump
MHPKPKIIAPVILLIILAVAAWWYFNGRPASAQSGALAASGTIEAVQVNLSAEILGKVSEVLVNEGDKVVAGQDLVRLDDRLLQAQLKQAEAALQIARANYDLVAAGQPVEQRQAAQAAAQLEVTAAQQALEDLLENVDLSAAQIWKAIAAAQKALDDADDLIEVLGSNADPADIDAAEAAVVLARDQLDKAREDFEPYENKPEDNVIRAMLQTKLAEAQKKYDSSVTRLNNLQGTASDLDKNLAEADKELILSQLEDARRRYDELKDGPDPDALALAEARLSLAEAQLALSKIEPSPEQLAVAQAQIAAAEASRELIRTQLDKLVLTSPMDGTVLNRLVEPGEMATPGSGVLTLADLNDITITVYVPEDRYGLIDLGQTAQVSVDSYPGEQFTGQVVRIADRAEFTPRNVQTPEGRRTTVFAVKLAVENPEGKLKPGMPADVSFGQD